MFQRVWLFLSVQILGRASSVIFYYNQQMHNYLMTVYIITVSLCNLHSCFFLLFPLILMLNYFGVICLVLHVLLNRMAAFVFSNFSLAFL